MLHPFLLTALLGYAAFFFLLARIHRADGVDTAGVARVFLLLLPPFLLAAGFTLLPLSAVALSPPSAEAVVSVSGGNASLKLLSRVRESAPGLVFEPSSTVWLALEAAAIGLVPYAAYRLGGGLRLEAVKLPAALAAAVKVAVKGWRSRELEALSGEVELLAARLEILEAEVKELKAGRRGGAAELPLVVEVE
ncbi:MAG: hypothetical protein QXI55_06190 [Thermofilum sp.]